MLKNSLLNILLLIIFCMITFIRSSSAAEEQLSVGDDAVEFPQDKLWLGGEPVSIAQNKGKKVTMIYFMKPGCGSCDKFAPHLYRLMLKNKSELEVVGVTEYPVEKIEEYLQKRLGDYPIMNDPERSFMNRYIGEIEKYPYIAIIDREGKLAWFGRGKFHSQVTAELDNVLNNTASNADEVFKPKKLNALVVGVDKSDLVPAALTTADNNAELLSTALQDDGFSVTEKLVGEQATLDNTAKSMEKIAAASTEEDAALLYFSGEAVPEKTVEGIDLKLYLKDSEVSLKKIVSDFKAASKCENVFVVIDANNEKSYFAEWEDIAGDMENVFSGVTVMLAAARWDRSLIGDNENTTIFTEKLASLIKDSRDAQKEYTPYTLWRGIRDAMSVISRKNGILQSPFIINRKEFAVTVK